MESYVCPACQSVVSADRREAHESKWCPALPDSEEEASGEVEDKPKAARMGGPFASLSPLCEETLHVRFGGAPDLHFELEQGDVFGPLDTGASLWHADRVMSQYLVTSCMDSMWPAGERPTKSGVALVLGCGGVPLSGLVASALGWDVIVTDLEPVLELTRVNVSLAADAIKASRRSAGFEDNVSVSVQELYFGDDAVLKSMLGSRGEDQPLMVCCSDCIWQRFLHEGLLCTIASALKHAQGIGRASASALFCFQRRSPETEAMFFKLLRQRFSCFDVEHIDTSATLAELQWPPQVQLQSADLQHLFPLMRLTLKEGAEVPIMPATKAEKKPWW
eukprot:TRINITY_DN43351_c0_g1_i1.p1 TRINITY_DN43351_c0_g1~~TRINITY_DN43351_c0_g1_i1.p1  ORF type:complete len:334 (-),score=64.46 TRINITY_DN43351_c0_g1_i1:23-1024(-)